MSSNKRDDNRVPNISGVRSDTLTGNVEPAVNPTTHAWLMQSGNTGDATPVTQSITTQDLASATATGANGQSIVIGTPTVGSAASFSLAGYATVRVEVTGVWTGTIASEISIDGGIVWVALGLHQGAYTISTFTAGFVGGGSVSGATNYRIRATGAITGTAVVRVTESINPQSVYIANAAPSGNVISTTNSSIVTLGGGAVFTGVGEDVSNFSEMRVSVFSNVTSATDGLSIQQSTDNVNWDITDTYTIPPAIGKTYVVPRQAKWFRVIYTNGASSQGSFRLSSLLNRAGTSSSSQRASDGYTNETDLQEVWAFGSIFNGVTWDRSYNNTTGVVVVAGATTTQSNIAVTNYNSRGLVILINTTAGAGSLIVTVKAATASGYSYTLLTSASLTGIAATPLRIFPGATASANAVANDIVPRNLQITATVTGVFTYGIDYILTN